MKPFLLLIFQLLMFIEKPLAAWECSLPNEHFFHKNSDQTEKWQIQADFNKINDPLIALSEKEKAKSVGLLKINNAEAQTRVTVEARGKFRFEECSQRPFHIKPLDKKQEVKYPFLPNFEKIKVVTICHSFAGYREGEVRNLLKEYTIYKMINHLAGPHLQVKKIYLELLDQNSIPYLAVPGFIIEPIRALEKRCQLKERGPVVRKWDENKKMKIPWLINKDRSLSPYPYQVDVEAELRMQITNRFLGNIDYEKDFDHNLIPLVPQQSSDLREFLIPYDFDLSEAAGSTYYSPTLPAVKHAEKLKNWLETELSYPVDLKNILIKEFLTALPKMEDEVNKSSLDFKGKEDLLTWIRAFKQQLSAVFLT